VEEATEHERATEREAATEQEAAGSGGTTEHNVNAELLELEHAGWQALSTGRSKGADHYGALLTEHALMVLANGQVMTRDEVVASLREAPPWDTYTIEEPRVLAITHDVRAVVYRATATRGDTRFRGAMTSVYVRADARWRLALYQQTAAG
jgi:hypothetical protein